MAAAGVKAAAAVGEAQCGLSTVAAENRAGAQMAYWRYLRLFGGLRERVREFNARLCLALLLYYGY